MKNRLLLIMLVGCLAGIVFGGGSSINSDFVENKKTEKTSIVNSFSYSNLNSLSSTGFSNITLSLNGLCDGPPPPPPPGPNPTSVNPPCVDLSEDDNDKTLYGNTQKDARFMATENYVARYYEEVPSKPGTFKYYDERSVNVNNEGVEPDEEKKPGGDGNGFAIQIPSPYTAANNYGYYKVEIVEVRTGEIMATVGVEVHYPNFRIPSPF